MTPDEVKALATDAVFARVRANGQAASIDHWQVAHVISDVIDQMRRGGISDLVIRNTLITPPRSHAEIRKANTDEA